MDEAASSAAITIRPAVSADADGITRTFLESAEYHAGLDPERYVVPKFEEISARYRDARQHSPDVGEPGITLVAELSGEIVGFADTRLYTSPDPMHRDITYCHIVEIAVSRQHQGQGVGERLLLAAEDWGRQNGAELALLEYLAPNGRAASFYQRRMGYHVAAMVAIKRL
jgi:ribosomal protein S18 acetylase RimI-like enzyme